MAGPAHQHLPLHDPACHATPIPKPETRRSSRTRTPSASLVRFTAGEIPESQSDIEANIEAERQAVRSSMAEAPGAGVGAKRARTGGNGDDGGDDARGGKKKAAGAKGPGKAMTKAQLAAHLKREIKTAPETKLVECPSVFIRALCHEKVDDFQWSEYRNKPIFVAKEHDTIANVFRGLIHHNLQSVPVTSKDMEKYHAFVDLADVVRYVVAHFGADTVGRDKSFWELLKEEKTFETKIVRDLQQHPYATRNRFHAIPLGFSVFTVFDAMAKIPGLRRVAIVDSQNNLFHLITQSQLIDHLLRNVVLLGPKGRKPLGSCPALYKRVYTVAESDTALDGFRMIDAKGVSGIGIVDAHGRLKGNLSTRDLKALSHDLRMFWRLQQTVKNFVLHLRREFQARHHRPQRLVFAKSSDTLEAVVRKLAAHKVHRLYIVDSRRIPIGLVSLRDVIAEVLSERKESVQALTEEYRQALSHEASVEDIEGVDFEEADAEPTIPAPAVPPAPPFQVPAVPATATAPGTPAHLLYPTAPPHTVVPVQATSVRPFQAQPPLAITDLSVGSGGRNIPIVPHQQLPGAPAQGVVPVPGASPSGPTGVAGHAAPVPVPPPISMAK